jgi:hypothetical protein
MVLKSMGHMDISLISSCDRILVKRPTSQGGNIILAIGGAGGVGSKGNAPQPH